MRRIKPTPEQRTMIGRIRQALAEPGEAARFASVERVPQEPARSVISSRRKSAWSR
jgi:hypothetical protein